VITWKHTFSRKMLIKGLQILESRFVTCTRSERRLPYVPSIGFQNLEPVAHATGYGFICTRLNISVRSCRVLRDERVLAQLRQFAQVAKAVDFSRRQGAMFGSTMRQVAVTDGDRVESQIVSAGK
jgi:L-arabinose isomerase